MRLILILTLSILPAIADAATRHVEVTGVDGPSCGSNASPCRSIGQGIANAAAGDSVVVGPGVYGDLNGDGVLGASGEENPDLFSPGCGCVLALNKAVKLTSSAGAAATVIDARTIASATNVLVIAGARAQFGKPGKGFTVTNTAASTGNGITIDADQVVIAGNQVIGPGTAASSFTGTGIATVDADETILITGNQVIGWDDGIVVNNAGKTVSKNNVSQNSFAGILAAGTSASPAQVTGNVATANNRGIQVGSAVNVAGNAAYANSLGIRIGGTQAPNPVVTHNNIFANTSCGYSNTASGQLDASENYWGAATGPGAYPADGVCLPVQATVTTAPFATAPFKVKAPIKP
jgi:hypothetical protein